MPNVPTMKVQSLLPCLPPLREKSNQKVLWDALAQGFIDTVGTDHCPFDIEQKATGQR